MAVVVVESPAKAKTINQYLGPGYTVLASYGHVRDLPAKDGSVDPDHDFEMKWEVAPESQKHVRAIAEALKSDGKLILATDPDREGEAISWHLLQALTGRKAVKKDTEVARVAFNAITKAAVNQAMENPRQIDMELVDAYLARRALDYLVGFKLSPVLWRKLPGAKLRRPRPVRGAPPHRRPRDGDRGLPRPRVLDRQGPPRHPARRHLRGPSRQPRRQEARQVRPRRRRPPPPAPSPPSRRATSPSPRSKSKPATRNPAAPFMTSTLQQEASRKFGFGARQTMNAAQRLYEAGHITYMRTDGIDMAPEAVMAAREVIKAALRRALCPILPAHVQEQGEERPGSPRVHPPDRHGPAPRQRPPRDRPVEALRPDLEALPRQPDGSRPLRAHHRRHRLRRQGGGPARHRPGRDLRRLPQGLPRRPRRRGHRPLRRRRRRPPAADRHRRARRQAQHHAGAALHPAAAALHRGDAGQAHGGARHRPPLDLRLDRLDDPGAGIRPQGGQPALPRGQGPSRHRLPRQLLRPLRRLRLHRRPRGGSRPGDDRRRGLEGPPRPVLEGFLRRPWRDRRPAHHGSPGQDQRGARAPPLPEDGGGSRAPPLQGVRHRPPLAQDFAQRLGLHRLLELPRVPLHPPAGRRRRGRRRPRRQAPRHGHAGWRRLRGRGRGTARDAAQGPLRLLRPARRGGGRREASARLDPQGHGPRAPRPSSARSISSPFPGGSAPTRTTASRSRPASAASAPT